MSESVMVSVVIPAYNAASTIAEALTSVITQTYSHWETIVVDDGSTDATADIADGFAARDPRIRIVRQSQRGDAGARNAGIDHARYDWLLFLDADDWIAPTHLERLTGALEANRDLDAVLCGSVRVAQDGTRVSDGYEVPTGDLFPTLANRAAFPVHACVVRASLVRAVGKFDVSLQQSADWDLWQRVARTGARFGAVREVLAYYRMQPTSHSMGAEQLLRDGLRVLRQGHAPDTRVSHPHPLHANGAPPDQIRSQQFYLLCWCAGLLIGRSRDALPLFAILDEGETSELYPDAVARCLFESATLPTCRTSAAWETLWAEVGPHVEQFLTALGARSPTPDLASLAALELKRLILRTSPSWHVVIEDLERTTATQGQHLEEAARTTAALRERLDEMSAQQAAEAQQTQNRIDAFETQSLRQAQQLTDLQADRTRLEAERTRLEADRRQWQQRTEEVRDALTSEQRQTEALQSGLAALQQQLRAVQDEHAATREALTGEQRRRADLQRRFDDLSARPLVRLARRLESMWDRAAGARALVGFQWQLMRLRVDGVTSRLLRPTRQRVVATACWQFPIYSQTFVYQELTQLIRSGRSVRFLYGELDRQHAMPDQFQPLWRSRRRFLMHPAVCRQSYEHFARTPERIDALVALLSEASGLSPADVRAHYHFGQAFVFARMVEAYQPDYLHSYFFYEGTLFTLVASHLLGLPRGVSCYADHMLDDYALKVVPVHLRQCRVIVATSERIKQELLAIAPLAHPDSVLVKPNGINVTAFPRQPPVEPEAGQPFRLVSVSRIEPKKGLIDLVDAVGHLRDRGVAVEAHLLGGVDQSPASRAHAEALGERIRALGLTARVHLEGPQTEAGIKAFFARSQVFVAPYVETDSGDKDGIPTSLLEAMSSGLPVVATDAGSIEEVIVDDRDGVLVPQRNPAALAEALAGLLADPARRTRLSETGARRIREAFDASTCERQLHDRLQRISSVTAGHTAEAR